jgi:hypothetical protein
LALRPPPSWALLAAALLGSCRASCRLRLALTDECASCSGPGVCADIERSGLPVMGHLASTSLGRGEERAEALRASEAAVRAVAEVEGRLSTWEATRSFSRLNATLRAEPFARPTRSPRSRSAVGELWRVTDGERSTRGTRARGGWGLRTGGRCADGGGAAAAARVGVFIRVRPTDRLPRAGHALARIEDRGFGKGVTRAALEELAASARARRARSGGQVAVLGRVRRARARRSPLPRAPVLELRLGPGSLSTSGNSERGIVVNGFRAPRPHPDPRMRRPRRTSAGLTVFAPDATTAERAPTGCTARARGGVRMDRGAPGRRGGSSSSCWSRAVTGSCAPP